MLLFSFITVILLKLAYKSLGNSAYKHWELEKISSRKKKKSISTTCPLAHRSQSKTPEKP